MTDDEIYARMVERAIMCDHTHIALKRAEIFSEEKLMALDEADKKLAKNPTPGIEEWKKLYDEHSIDPAAAWTITHHDGKKYWEHFTFKRSGLLKLRVGDMVIVRRAPVGGFTHPFLGMIGTVLGVDDSRVPYTVRFDLPNGKFEVSPFLEGRLDMIEPYNGLRRPDYLNEGR